MGDRVLETGRWFLHVAIILHHLCVCQGKIYMNVSPYPARIYENAPEGVPVLTVQAYDNTTGEAISNFRLDDTGEASYFAINASGILYTARRIDRVIGYQFKFFVFAMGKGAGSAEWKHVIIEVAEENLYPPQFNQSSYNFSVYRHAAPGTIIAAVTATDSDSDPHNRHFTIYAPPRQSALRYVSVTSAGDVILAKTPPEAKTPLEVLILAVDNGSPQRTGTTTASIVMDDVKQPSTFCLSTTDTDTTLCWKNPMPGRRNQGYDVLVQGEGLVLHKHVKGNANTEEFCISTSDLQLGQNYTFQVTLDDDDSASVELSFLSLSEGYSPDCTDNNFNVCNFLLPCKNGAKCTAEESEGVDYACRCSKGWQGTNCTHEDLCPTQPCHNKGTCFFTGHQQFVCQCKPDYLGLTCENLDLCAANSPCENGGVCRMDDSGTYSCACPDYFTGRNCTIADPCSPSPCGERGDCVKISDTQTECVCHPGYHGDQCDEVDVCQIKPPCENGGTCTLGANSSFTCTCPPAYTGRKCELFNACTLACKNNATCHMSEDGLYHCACLPAFHGNECQYYNRCHDDPCKNGTCNMNEDLPLCDCHPGFHGPACEDYNVCLQDPCGGHGDCLPLPPGPLESGDLPYECGCYGGWWGLQCQFPDLCQEGVCENGGQCRNVPPSNVSCDCADSHYGDRCQHSNPCVSSPCLNAGRCHNLTDLLYNCTCRPGYSGPRCQQESACTRLPCANGGTCVGDGDDDGDGSVRCACPEGFLGYYCQLPDPCFDGHGDGQGSACAHGGCEGVNRTLAQQLTGEVAEVQLFRCRCDEGYAGERCEVAVPPCDEGQCLNSGHCRQGVCVCPPGFTGTQCETSEQLCGDVVCGEGLRCLATGFTHTCVCENDSPSLDCVPVCGAEEVVSEKTGRFLWPETAAGHSAEVTCPYGPRANLTDGVTRPCVLSLQHTAVWGEGDDSNCNEMGLLEASRRLSALKELTSHPASLRTSEVNNYTSILEELYMYTLMDYNVASLMMNVISNLADVNVSVTVASDVENNTSERLLNLLDQYTADVNVTSSGDNVSIPTPNFEIMAVSVENTSPPVRFVPSVEAPDSVRAELGVTITIPPEAFAAEHAEEMTSNRKPAHRNGKPLRVQLIGHRKSQLFIPRGSAYSEKEIQYQQVISASISGKRVLELSSPVVYSIRNWQTQSNYTCVFWNPKNHTWSTNGVTTVVKSGNFTECHSVHLTSFAVLLDPSPHYVLSATHEAVLSHISYVGSAISLFCLLLTIITYALFRSLNKDKSGKILLHLCVALLFLNAVFLASGLGSSADRDDDLDDDKVSCTAVAALLHYLLLASLSWMLVEAVEMYRALVTVFAKYAQCYMIKRCLIGWGLPLVIVAVTLGADTENYDTDGAFCFISRSRLGAYYGSLVAPACLVLLINTVIFVLVTRVILKPRFQQQKQKGPEGITPAQVRGAFTVMFLLGVTWVFGPLAIKEAKVVFNYLFCILNSLQGFLIFVFRCVFNPEVRMCWVQLVKTGTLKKRRGPIRSNVYSDTTSKAEGKSGTYHNDSHGMAYTGSNGSSKTSLRTSNGWHPKLNGYPSGQIMERRGTKFSTLDYTHGTPDSVKKTQQNALTKDERYGDGNLDHEEDPNFFPVLDYYETGHNGRGGDACSASLEEFHGDGDVLDYYESIRSSRKEDSSGVRDGQDEGQVSAGDKEDGRGSPSENRSFGRKQDCDELTYL